MFAIHLFAYFQMFKSSRALFSNYGSSIKSPSRFNFLKMYHHCSESKLLAQTFPKPFATLANTFRGGKKNNLAFGKNLITSYNLRNNSQLCRTEEKMFGLDSAFVTVGGPSKNG